MSFHYTPAAERAVVAAANWVTRDADDDISPQALLIGLREQQESRAAKQLEQAGIDIEQIRRWKPIDERSKSDHAADRRLSIEAENAVYNAILRLDENPRTCQVATEHILLGLALAENELGAWLRAGGVDPAAMEAEICERYGIDRTPIAVDFDDESDSPPLSSVERGAGGEGAAAASRPFANDSVAIFRILDAAANRAGEALRVVEDHARFAVDDAELTRECKALRHDLAAALAAIPWSDRLAARDTPHDVGTTISTDSEHRRDNLHDVVTANMRRLQEALRSLEEYGKLLNSSLGAKFEQLRYRSYTLHKQLADFQPSGGRGSCRAASSPGDRHLLLQKAKLYVLIDGRRSAEEFETLVHQLVGAGVDVLQLRDKTLDDRTLLARARILRRATAGTAALFIMNDRCDLAVVAEADGVHVGQDELTVAEARAIVGGDRLVGVSTHTIEQAREAAADGADYIGVGPTFPSSTKQFDAFPGLDLVRAVTAEIKIPAFAIGGISADNIQDVRNAGLHRVAVSGAITQAADATTAAIQLRAALG